jgi:hypothetical protein
VQAAVNAASSGETVYLRGTTPYDGQVIITKSTTPGSVDFGSHDVVIYNDISGAGYANHPACTTTQPYSTDKLDTIGPVGPLVLSSSWPARIQY